MEIIKIGNNQSIVRNYDFNSQEPYEHDELIGLSLQGTVLFAGSNDIDHDRKMMNSSDIFDFMSATVLEDYNIEFAPQLLQLIDINNFDKIKEQFFIKEFANIVGNFEENRERVVEAINALSDRLGVNNAQLANQGKILIDVNGVEQEFMLKHTREQEGIKINLNLRLVEDTDDDNYEKIPEQVNLLINTNYYNRVYLIIRDKGIIKDIANADKYLLITPVRPTHNELFSTECPDKIIAFMNTDDNINFDSILATIPIADYIIDKLADNQSIAYTNNPTGCPKEAREILFLGNSNSKDTCWVKKFYIVPNDVKLLEKAGFELVS